ncbi:MAG: DNA topoisomerase (ATP-hydrolyzing) subunit A [Mycoplasma sp.]
MAHNPIKEENQVKDELLKTKIIDRPIVSELKSSFLEYSMSVIVARALPDARDGFKPVHRRVLFAAHGLGMTPTRPYKKSARLVGEVIGKFHPHGDLAVYGTMVRMAQDFSMRYPLMDGHGNFGSIDGDNAAAMRYTEIRMSRIAETMLQDINKDTVKFADNYDGSETEPTVLPSLFPNLLANGSNGIAVGMATNIPPHNLGELVAAIKLVAKNPECSINDIKQVLKGPDFPTKAQIVGAKGIDDYFNTGRGSVIVRARYTYTTNESTGKSTIIFNEIPYQVNKKNLLLKISDLAQEKDNPAQAINGIADLRDESNREGIRIVVETKRDVSPEVLINQLYKKTQLQTSFPVNMLALVDNQPQLLNIKQVLEIYLKHQIEVLNKRVNFDLNADLERQHVLEGLAIANKNIDEVIKIIRNASSDEQASNGLKQKFNLSDRQTKAILDMRLRTLSRLEREKLDQELNALGVEIQSFKELLADKNKQIDDIIERLENLNKKYGDERLTQIDADVNVDISDEDLIKPTDILLTLSNRGYLKRLPVDTYRPQRRGGVGVIGTTTYEDDDVSRIIVANTHTDILVFTNKGKVYRLRGHQFPLGSRTAKGYPAIEIIPSIEKDERVVTLLPVNEYNANSYLFLTTKQGLVKKTRMDEYERINSNGKICISLLENDNLFDVIQVENDDEILLSGSNGKLVRFANAEVRPTGRTSQGITGITFDSNNDEVVGVSTNRQGQYILSIGTKGIGKLTPVSEYRLTKRKAKGVKTLKVTPKTGPLVATISVELTDDILIITSKNKVIRFNVNQISETSRNTQGVKLVNLDDGDKVKDITAFKKELGMSEEEIQEQNPSINETPVVENPSEENNNQ